MVVPHYKINWQDAIIGGFLTACLVEIARAGFRIYINKFADYEAIYGALATIPVFLVWLFTFWLIVLFGAIFVHIKYQQRKLKTP